MFWEFGGDVKVSRKTGNMIGNIDLEYDKDIIVCLSKDFSLGDKFDTSNVTDMSYMFSGEVAFNEGSRVINFSFGDKFDTSSVTNMSGMFGEDGKYNATKNFSLGDKFDTSNVTDMSYMFDWFGCEK